MLLAGLRVPVQWGKVKDPTGLSIIPATCRGTMGGTWSSQEQLMRQKRQGGKGQSSVGDNARAQCSCGSLGRLGGHRLHTPRAAAETVSLAHRAAGQRVLSGQLWKPRLPAQKGRSCSILPPPPDESLGVLCSYECAAPSLSSQLRSDSEAAGSDLTVTCVALLSGKAALS